MANEGPFIIAVEEVLMTRPHVAVPVAVPVGIELADCQRHAYEQAIRRWPNRIVLMPYFWETLHPSIRLSALEADRQTNSQFRLKPFSPAKLYS